MYTPKHIITVDDLNTVAVAEWRVQSTGYETALDARMVAAKVSVVKQGAIVKPLDGKWAVYYREFR